MSNVYDKLEVVIQLLLFVLNSITEVDLFTKYLIEEAWTNNL